MHYVLTLRTFSKTLYKKEGVNNVVKNSGQDYGD